MNNLSRRAIRVARLGHHPPPPSAKAEKPRYAIGGSVVALLASAVLLALSTPSFAQWAVRDEFPNGSLRGNGYEYFAKEQWEASNFAAPQAMNEWQGRRYGMFIHFGITAKAQRDLS